MSAPQIYPTLVYREAKFFEGRIVGEVWYVPQIKEMKAVTTLASYPLTLDEAELPLKELVEKYPYKPPALEGEILPPLKQPDASPGE